MKKVSKKGKRIGQQGHKKIEPEERETDEKGEIKKFIKRLEIQRKLLDNLVDLTTIKTQQTADAVEKSLEIRPNN
jgi:hypothetical protein